MSDVLRTLVGIVVLVVIVLVNTVMVMWIERKLLGHIQSRLGPMRTGFHGLLQPIADAFKLLGKQDLMPAGADRVLFLIAPLIAFTPSVLVYTAMPWVASFAGFELEVGVFMIFAVAAMFPVGILVAGWSSHNKYSLIGGFRSAAQQISYEVPMILAAMGVGQLCLPYYLFKRALVHSRPVEAALISLLEPIMIVFLGFTIGAIVISLFLPLIKLLEGLSK